MKRNLIFKSKMSSPYHEIFKFIYASLEKLINDLKVLKENESKHFFPTAYLTIKNLEIPYLSAKGKLTLIIPLLKRVRYCNVNDQIENLEDVISYFDSLMSDKESSWSINERIFVEMSSTEPEVKNLYLKSLEEVITSQVNFFGPMPLLNQILNIHLKLFEDLKSISPIESEQDLNQKISQFEIGFVSKNAANKIKRSVIAYLRNIHQTTGEYNVNPALDFISKVMMVRIDIFNSCFSNQKVNNELINEGEKGILETIFIEDGFFETD